MLSSLDSFDNSQFSILAVDDSLDNLILLQTLLEDEGYTVELTESGQEALQKVKQNPPHLILLDVMMPTMDGYEVTQRIRQDARLPFIPILLITAHDRSSVVKGLDNGADDFIRKPFDMEELLARVRSLLRLKHSIDEREAMIQQREDFVSRLTHDLRTPLVAADRMFHLMQSGSFGPPSDDMVEALNSIIQNNQNLLSMVNMLLEVYRHDAGQKKLTFVACHLPTLLQEVVGELAPLAEEKGLDLILEFAGEPKGRPPLEQVFGDQLELRRVFTNLVGNAIKFTDQGSVLVRMQGMGNTEAGDRWVVIEVVDTGPGIPPEDLAELFQRFRHGNHRRAGSGLGLHLSSRIVEAHNGSLTVQSAVEQGSCFTVKLPAP